MSERAMMIDAFLMGAAAAVVAFVLLVPHGLFVQVIGAYVVGRVVGIVLMRLLDG